MIRVINAAEHNLFCDAGTPITVSGATTTTALPSEQGLNTGEIAYRFIQNVGANPLFYALGSNCTTANYNGVLGGSATGAGEQLNCSNHRLAVSVYSTSGTTVATTVIRRADLAK